MILLKCFNFKHYLKNMARSLNLRERTKFSSQEGNLVVYIIEKTFKMSSFMNCMLCQVWGEFHFNCYWHSYMFTKVHILVTQMLIWNYLASLKSYINGNYCKIIEKKIKKKKKSIFKCIIVLEQVWNHVNACF